MNAPFDPSAIVECVPNVSDGRRSDVIERIRAAAASVRGASVLDVHTDADHNRSVYTIAGAASAVAESAFRLAEAAVREIDMRQHRGTHPRIGALDVLPFVPLGSTSMTTCVALAHAVGLRIGSALDVPVYFYGEAALTDGRRRLVDVRRGEYEGLARSIQEGTHAPDAGPPGLGKAGATAVGARGPLIAFNVHLRTGDVSVASTIARRIRASSGGLPGVQALGLPTSRPEVVQVSMNLTDIGLTSLSDVVARIRAEARVFGVDVGASELVGLMPLAAALEAAAAQLDLPGLGMDQILDVALLNARMGS
ncbi:MAG: glutamate formiminotransferase [Chloroflexi bacterium]|nr:glutamate formiminotransferase [Chloroflexota bacterium]